MGIYLEPETTFSVSVNSIGGGDFVVTEGTDITLRTATGKEYAAILKAIREENAGAGYDLLAKFSTGLDVPRLHPNVTALLLFEVAKRSHLSEKQAGN